MVAASLLAVILLVLITSACALNGLWELLAEHDEKRRRP